MGKANQCLAAGWEEGIDCKGGTRKLWGDENVLDFDYGTSLVAQMVKRLPTMWETQVQSLGQEDLLEKKWQPTPVFLPGKSHGHRRLLGYSP